MRSWTFTVLVLFIISANSQEVAQPPGVPPVPETPDLLGSDNFTVDSNSTTTTRSGDNVTNSVQDPGVQIQHHDPLVVSLLPEPNTTAVSVLAETRALLLKLFSGSKSGLVPAEELTSELAPLQKSVMSAGGRLKARTKAGGFEVIAKVDNTEVGLERSVEELLYFEKVKLADTAKDLNLAENASGTSQGGGNAGNGSDVVSTKYPPLNEDELHSAFESDSGSAEEKAIRDRRREISRKMKKVMKFSREGNVKKMKRELYELDEEVTKNQGEMKAKFKDKTLMLRVELDGYILFGRGDNVVMKKKEVAGMKEEVAGMSADSGESVSSTEGAGQ